MTTIKQIFENFAPEYVHCFADAMPRVHHKVIEAIVNCRTETYGISVYECEACAQLHRIFRSCGNRHCPTCQNHKSRQWLQRQLINQLPGHHFMITFTVPGQLRRFIRSHQKICYAALFKASSDALKLLAADPKHIGGDLPGFYGILHTWGRQMHYHPHIHYIVPGGALSKSDDRWYCSRIDFYVPVKALSKIFAATFRNEMKKNAMIDDIPDQVWQIAWNVNIQAVGSSENSVRYLAPYVFKVAISNSRIVKVENRQVTFRYKKSKSCRWRTTTVDVLEFMRRFLQHVLPTGFMKVRYYGFMNPNASVTLDDIKVLIELAYGFEVKSPQPDIQSIPSLVCSCCGGNLAYRYSLLPYQFKDAADTG